MFIKVTYKYLHCSLFLNLNAIQVNVKLSIMRAKNNVLKNYTQSTKQKIWRKITETIQPKAKA